MSAEGLFMRLVRVFAIFAVLTLAASAFAQHRSVRVQVIDRGQADGILIRTPNDKWVIIDAGKEQPTGRVDGECLGRR